VSAASKREELAAAIRREAAYLDRQTGRYATAISESALDAILDRADAYASSFAAETIDELIGEGR
jgi:hypothetical protein